MAKKIASSKVIEAIKSILTTPEGKRMRFDPKLLSPEVVKEVVKAYVSTEGEYAHITNMKGVARYFSDDNFKLSEDRAKKIVYQVYEDPFNYGINLADQVTTVSSGNMERHATFNKYSLHSTEWNSLYLVCNTRLARLEEDVHKHLLTIKEALTWFINDKLTLKKTLYKYGWSGDEFRFILRYAACVFLTEQEYAKLRYKYYNLAMATGYRKDAFDFLRDTGIFRANYADDFQRLSELRLSPEKNEEALKEMYDSLYKKFLDPASFQQKPKEEAPAENADTAEG